MNSGNSKRFNPLSDFFIGRWGSVQMTFLNIGAVNPLKLFPVPDRFILINMCKIQYQILASVSHSVSSCNNCRSITSLFSRNNFVT